MNAYIRTKGTKVSMFLTSAKCILAIPLIAALAGPAVNAQVKTVIDKPKYFQQADQQKNNYFGAILNKSEMYMKGSASPGGGGHVFHGKLFDVYDIESSEEFDLATLPAYLNYAKPALVRFEKLVPGLGNYIRTATYSKAWVFDKKELNCNFMSLVKIAAVPAACQDDIQIRIDQVAFSLMTESSQGELIVHEIVRAASDLPLLADALKTDQRIRNLNIAILNAQTEAQVAKMISSLGVAAMDFASVKHVINPPNQWAWEQSSSMIASNSRNLSKWQWAEKQISRLMLEDLAKNNCDLLLQDINTFSTKEVRRRFFSNENYNYAKVWYGSPNYVGDVSAEQFQADPFQYLKMSKSEFKDSCTQKISESGMDFNVDKYIYHVKDQEFLVEDTLCTNRTVEGIDSKNVSPKKLSSMLNNSPTLIVVDRASSTNPTLYATYAGETKIEVFSSKARTDLIGYVVTLAKNLQNKTPKSEELRCAEFKNHIAQIASSDDDVELLHLLEDYSNEKN